MNFTCYSFRRYSRKTVRRYELPTAGGVGISDSTTAVLTVHSAWRHLSQLLSDFLDQSHGQLNSCICGGIFEQQQQDLQHQHFMGHRLVHQMGQQFGGRQTLLLQVASEALSEVQHQSPKNQLSNLGKLKHKTHIQPLLLSPIYSNVIQKSLS